MNRPVSLSAESRINAVGQSQHLFFELRIFLDLRAARRGNLDKRKPPSPLGLQLQESFGGQKAFKDALRVVETLDSQSHAVIGRQRIDLPYPPAAFGDRRLAIQRAARPLDRDWIGIDRCQFPSV